MYIITVTSPQAGFNEQLSYFANDIKENLNTNNCLRNILHSYMYTFKVHR